jgi:hypothetical protein
MSTYDLLKESTQIVTDNRGKPVVQIPLELWDTLLLQLHDLSQSERLKLLLAQWDAEADESLDRDWEAFDAFVRENRLRFNHNALDS